jgi:hypothetical protein
MIWRYLLAIGLSMLVIVAWGHFFPPPPARKGGEVQPGAAPIGGKIEPPAKEGPAERAPAAAPAARPERPAASLEVQSGEDVRARVGARGGVLTTLRGV